MEKNKIIILKFKFRINKYFKFIVERKKNSDVTEVVKNKYELYMFS